MSKKFDTFALRIHPGKLGFSPKLTAIVGAIIGHDYGVRDARGGKLTSLSITSDGFVICHSTMSDGGGAFLGSADDLQRNLKLFVAELAPKDFAEFSKLYGQNVKDWRQ